MRVNFPWGNISGFSFATFPKIEMSLTSRWRSQKDFMDEIGSYVNVQKKERGRQTKVGFCIWFSKKYLIHITRIFISFLFQVQILVLKVS